MAKIKWAEIDKKPGRQNFIDEEKNHYIIMQLNPDKFGVVWLRYPDAFMNFCKTHGAAKAFCESHKKYFSGLYVLDKRVVPKTARKLPPAKVRKTVHKLPPIPKTARKLPPSKVRKTVHKLPPIPKTARKLPPAKKKRT